MADKEHFQDPFDSISVFLPQKPVGKKPAVFIPAGAASERIPRRSRQESLEQEVFLTLYYEIEDIALQKPQQ